MPRVLIGLAGFSGQAMFDACHIGRDSRFTLVADINLASSVFADQDHGKSRLATGLLLECLRGHSYAFAQPGGERLSVTACGCHLLNRRFQ